MRKSEIDEVGVDKLNERTHEKAKESGAHTPWLKWLALSTALFAVLAAIGSLKSSQLANESLLSMNEATLKQAQASDAWSYYQAKGNKQVTREAEVDVLTVSHASPDLIAKARAEADRYKSEQEDVQAEARRLEQEQKDLVLRSRRDLEHHHRVVYAITLLQVTIGLSAIAALIERRGVWFIALIGGLAGIGLLLYSVI
jgi:hypothetical protein